MITTACAQQSAPAHGTGRQPQLRAAIATTTPSHSLPPSHQPLRISRKMAILSIGAGFVSLSRSPAAHRSVNSAVHRFGAGAGRQISQRPGQAYMFQGFPFNLFKGRDASMSAGKGATELAPAQAPAGQSIATFAGGCFWGLELAFQRVPGVTHTSSGYTGGEVPSPSYEAVCSGRTGHAEAVQVYYDSSTSYPKLLDCFFEHVDPTTLNRQGGDVGTQYRSVIYYYDDAQKQAAEKAIQEVNGKLKAGTFRRVVGNKVVTTLEPATDYYIAEDYHQQYLSKGGRFGSPQSAAKGATDRIRCYG